MPLLNEIDETHLLLNTTRFEPYTPPTASFFTLLTDSAVHFS